MRDTLSFVRMLPSSIHTYPAGLPLAERLSDDGARAAAPGGRLHAHPPRGRQHRRQAAPQHGADPPQRPAKQAQAHRAPGPRVGRYEVQAVETSSDISSDL